VHDDLFALFASLPGYQRDDAGKVYQMMIGPMSISNYDVRLGEWDQPSVGTPPAAVELGYDLLSVYRVLFHKENAAISFFDYRADDKQCPNLGTLISPHASELPLQLAVSAEATLDRQGTWTSNIANDEHTGIAAGSFGNRAGPYGTSEDRFTRVTAYFDGHPIPVSLAMEANRSAISTSAANAAGVTDAQLAQDPGVIETTPPRRFGHRHHFEHLQLGDMIISGFDVDVFYDIAEPRLGADLLDRATLLYDVPDRKIWLAPISAQGVAMTALAKPFGWTPIHTRLAKSTIR